MGQVCSGRMMRTISPQTPNTILDSSSKEREPGAVEPDIDRSLLVKVALESVSLRSLR